MKIVLSGIFLGLLLMVVPLYIDYRFRLHLTQKLATSIGRLAFLVAVILVRLFERNSAFLSTAAMFFLTAR